jgi:hypothetical protein
LHVKEATWVRIRRERTLICKCIVTKNLFTKLGMKLSGRVLV